MFDKVLIANRGEIAARILRTCRRLGIPTVAVYSDADAGAPHVRLADEAVRLGPAPVRESYLAVDALVRAIRETGAAAVHPGYGLLSEQRGFAEAVADAGAVFIGPPPAALERLGDKLSARALARGVGVEPPPGSEGPLDPADADALRREAERVGYPVLLKAAGGGGGIGMQIVRDPAQLSVAARSCADRGRAAFGDERIYLERWVDRPRHIEVQVLCDAHGNAVALGERECSVQRRHQKVLEESPSPASMFHGPEGERRRHKLWDDALAVVRAAGYVNAGTVEFVADAGGRLWFLEVNARLQVEHPVTECVTGLDLVEWQLRVAAGEALPAELLEPSRSGHAVEVRLYAEDPAKGFVPQPGRVAALGWPAGEGVRVDAGVEAGSEITSFYDPMIAKLIAHGPDRATALERLRSALAETTLALEGPKGPRATNLAWLRELLEATEVIEGSYDTGIVERLVAAKKSR
ncbi:MAG: ATP-grasp domain-containing protein [Polyangiaceae bacterium]|nr:ATP-grasp domain-containing protein [Polyangiaceae bacterium]